MGLGDMFKLEKLEILAYKDRTRHSPAIGTFEAMFNPESITQKFKITYGKNQGIDSSNKPLNYAKSKPSDLSLSLILDGSGTTEMGVMQLLPQKGKSVAERITNFLQLTYGLNSDIHEPNYLVIQWAGLFEPFNCRLSSVDIHYTNIDRDGTPLRASLDIILISDESTETILKTEDKKSPDVSHSRIVRAGDTLPLLAKEIYGSSVYYLWVAKANGLDDIRRLTPGQRLVFPPLELKTGQ